MKFHLLTFGCQMNVADSGEMSGHLRNQGMTPALSLAEADLVLMNTCTVRQHAEDKALSALGRLRQWKRERPGRLVLLTGCAAERIREEVPRRFPHVDLVLGAKDIESFPKKLDELLKDHFDWFSETKKSFDVRRTTHDARPTTDVVAYVTIMRGCNYSCSYCIVPEVRGRESYRSSQEILPEIGDRIGQGAREVLLLGQTVNSYRDDSVGDFPGLLKEVDAVPGLLRTRFISPHPYHMKKHVIDTMANLKTVCEHVHLPVQSGSDRVLKRMKRNYARASYLDAIGYLREKIPGVSITTDIIVGFPGETEEDFRETLSLIGEAGFEKAFCFKYSPRPGTEAAKLPDDVPKEVKEERLSKILELTEERSRKTAERLVGTTQEILVESLGEGKWASGRTRGNWKVKVLLHPGLTASPGELILSKIRKAHGQQLEGEFCAN